MFRLLRYYSVASLIAVLATAVMLTWFYRQVAIEGIVQLAERSNLTLARAAGYQSLEARVWQGIERVRQARAAAPTLLAVRAAAVVGALGLGVASGGATAVAVAAQSQEVSAFSTKAELAPSTLLDHHG